MGALTRAAEVLEKQADECTRVSFVQAKAPKKLKAITDHAEQTGDTFLEESSPNVDAPKTSGCESRPGGIIEMLDNLLDEFIAERIGLEMEVDASAASHPSDATLSLLGSAGQKPRS